MRSEKVAHVFVWLALCLPSFIHPSTSIHDAEGVAPSQNAYDGHGNCYCGEEAVRLGMGCSWTKILLDERQHHGGFHSKLLNSPVNTRFLSYHPMRNARKSSVTFWLTFYTISSHSFETTTEIFHCQSNFGSLFQDLGVKRHKIN